MNVLDEVKPVRSTLDTDDDTTAYRLKAWLSDHPACLSCGLATDGSALCPDCGRGFNEECERLLKTGGKPFILPA